MNSKTDFTAVTKKKISFFTLLEVLISMGVFAILMLALMQFFVSAQAVVERTGSKAEFYDNSRIAMDLLANDLICVFYKPEYDGNLYTFMYYDTSDKTKIKFAATRPDGLAEVYYSWDSANLKLKLTTLKESVDFSTYSTAWVTRPNSSSPHAWVSSLDSAPAAKTVEIADNVVKFSIVLKKNSSSSGDSVPAADLKIPILAEINLAVISDDARKKLETMGINTNALSAKYSDDSSLTDAQKDILKAGTQEFKRIILIERGQ